MGAESAFEQAVRRIVEKSIPITVTEGTVKSVDKVKRTCDVERDDLPEIFDVRLAATLEPGDDDLIVFPKEGSRCLVALVEGQPTDAFMLSATDIEEVVLRIGESEMIINKDVIRAKIGTSEFEMGKEGLILKHDESIKDVLTKIVDAMMAITVTTAQGPSGTPINAPTAMQPIKQSINKIFKG